MDPAELRGEINLSIYFSKRLLKDIMNHYAITVKSTMARVSIFLSISLFC